MMYYLDTSALVKYYVQESGTPWVMGLCDPAAGHTIATARITQAEAAAAFARKYRNGDFSERDYTRILKQLADDFLFEFVLVEITASLINLAVSLTQRHKLRGYDAVQLASGLTLNAAVAQTRHAPITFVGADKVLLMAAQDEGLRADNPNRHS